MPPCPVSHRRLYFQWGKRTGDGKRVCWLWVNCLCIISLIKMFTCYFALFKAKIIRKFTKEKKMPLISSLLQVQVFREPKSSFFFLRNLSCPGDPGRVSDGFPVLGPSSSWRPTSTAWHLLKHPPASSFYQFPCWPQRASICYISTTQRVLSQHSWYNCSISYKDSAHQLGPTALLWLSNGCTGTSSCPGNPPTHLHYVSNNEVQVPLPEAPPSSRPPASSLSDWPLPFCLIWTPQATIQVRLSPSQGLLSPSNFSDPPTNSLLLTSSL